MAPSASDLEIGIASVDITPPEGVRLAGYGPRKGVAQEVGHLLRAEAMVVRGGDQVWCLVTSDLIGYPADFVERVREHIDAETDLPGDAVMISATHTHSGPAATRPYKSELKQIDHDYRDALGERLVDVVTRAYEDLRPGTFEVAMTEAPELGSNRRIQKSDGSWVNDWQDPEGKHPGYFDASVMLVGVRRPDGSRDILLTNYGVHPVCLGPRSLAISADYPGYMKDTLETRHACRTAMYALAGAGNINPRQAIMVGEQYPMQMGERLGEIVVEAVDRLEPLAAGPVRHHSEPWSLVTNRAWPEGSPREKGERVTSEVQALRAGDLVLLGIPGELFSEYTQMIREASPVPHTVVVSMANDVLGYLPTSEACEQGGHEINGAATAEPLQKDLMDHIHKALAAVGD